MRSDCPKIQFKNIRTENNYLLSTRQKLTGAFPTALHEDGATCGALMSAQCEVDRTGIVPERHCSLRRGPAVQSALQDESRGRGVELLGGGTGLGQRDGYRPILVFL